MIITLETIIGTSADLEIIQKEALSIPLSSLSHMEKIGEGIRVNSYCSKYILSTRMNKISNLGV